MIDHVFEPAEPLPARLHAALPALLQGWEPADGGPRRGQPLGLGLAAACTDLAGRVSAVQQRIAALEAACVQVARALPAFGLLQPIPGVGPPLAARLAKRAGERHAGLKAMVEGAAAILRTVWGVWRSGVPYDPTRAPGRGGGRPDGA